MIEGSERIKREKRGQYHVCTLFLRGDACIAECSDELTRENWGQLLVFVQKRMTQAMRISNTIQASSTFYVMKVRLPQL